MIRNMKRRQSRGMRRAIFVAPLGAVIGVLSIAPSGEVARAARLTADLTSQLEAIQTAHAHLCPSPTGSPGLRESVNDLLKQLDAGNGGSTPGAGVVEVLNRLLFNELRVKGSQELKDPCNLLPGRVLERKQGYCVGIAALYLVLAERLGLPIYAVATPAHVFLRYDDGVRRINIETFQRGAHLPDEQYVREHHIPERSIRRGVFLRNLTAGEFLAQVHNNLGVIFSERGLYERAATEYEEAVRLDPRLPAAWYNHGNDLLRQGDRRRAVRMFSRALRLYPTDVWALNNRGLAWLRLGDERKARKDFGAALRLDPAFEPARRNLEALPPRDR
jgi:regulator of sirC expression with transglutaminase-like and TPR domain